MPLRWERCDCPCGCAIPADDGPSCQFCLLGTHRDVDRSFGRPRGGAA